MKQSEIANMSVAEKLQAIEALWDALEDEELDTPQWHHDILEKRVQKLDSGEAETLSLDELKNKL